MREDALRDLRWMGRRGLAGFVLACAAVGCAQARGSAGMEPPEGERSSCGAGHEGDASTAHSAHCAGRELVN